MTTKVRSDEERLEQLNSLVDWFFDQNFAKEKLPEKIEEVCWTDADCVYLYQHLNKKHNVISKSKKTRDEKTFLLKRKSSVEAALKKHKTLLQNRPTPESLLEETPNATPPENVITLEIGEPLLNQNLFSNNPIAPIVDEPAAEDEVPEAGTTPSVVDEPAAENEVPEAGITPSVVDEPAAEDEMPEAATTPSVVDEEPVLPNVSDDENDLNGANPDDREIDNPDTDEGSAHTDDDDSDDKNNTISCHVNTPKPVKAPMDYNEAEYEKHPLVINELKRAYRNYGIACRAINPNQKDFPFIYNLYERDVTPSDDVFPTGKVKVESQSKVVLSSNDISQFIATMSGLKASGGTKIDLKLTQGSEEDKKAFAANAIIAGVMVGIEVAKSPYSLEELKEVNGMIQHVINLKAKEDRIKQASAEFERHKNATNEQKLETEMKEAFRYYQQMSADLIPAKEQLRIFACGATAVKKEASKKVMAKVIANAREA